VEQHSNVDIFSQQGLEPLYRVRDGDEIVGPSPKSKIDSLRDRFSHNAEIQRAGTDVWFYLDRYTWPTPFLPPLPPSNKPDRPHASPQKKKGTRLGLIIAVTVVVGLTLLIYTYDRAVNEKIRGVSKNVVYADVFKASSERVSDADLYLLQWLLANHGQKWNQLTMPLVRDYLDTRVTAEEWGNTYKQQSPRMRLHLNDARAKINQLEDVGCKRFMGELHDTFEKQLQKYEALASYCSTGDAEGQQRAVAEARSFALKRWDLFNESLQKLAEYEKVDNLDEVLKQHFENMKKQIEPRQ
jgi:hypothetical protein